MGNIVSDENQNLKEGKLKSIIENWANNTYDAGLNYGNTKKINQLLQKRACCTRQTSMLIGLPIIDGSNVNGGYYPVKIQLFNIDPQKITDPSEWDKYCFIDNDNSYYQLPINKETNPVANPNCTALYTNYNTGISENLNLCGSIEAERTINYSDNNQQISYGFYATDPAVIDSQNNQSFRTLETLNNYTDCNCLNSILRLIPNADKIQQMEQLVQSNDTFCTSCASEGICYIESDQKDQFLCLNVLNVGTEIAENSSNIIYNQNCGTINPPSPSSGISSLSTIFEYSTIAIIFVVAAVAGLIASGIIIL